MVGSMALSNSIRKSCIWAAILKNVIGSLKYHKTSLSSRMSCLWDILSRKRFDVLIVGCVVSGRSVPGVLPPWTFDVKTFCLGIAKGLILSCGRPKYHKICLSSIPWEARNLSATSDVSVWIWADALPVSANIRYGRHFCLLQIFECLVCPCKTALWNFVAKSYRHWEYRQQ
jgi:hypothetical protein